MKTYKKQEIADVEEITTGVYALIDVSPQGGNDHWSLQGDYGRKNMSREPCKRGWLGSTNNVSRTACGCVEVFKNKAGQLRIRQVDDDALVQPLDVDADDAIEIYNRVLDEVKDRIGKLDAALLRVNVAILNHNNWRLVVACAEFPHWSLLRDRIDMLAQSQRTGVLDPSPEVLAEIRAALPGLEAACQERLNRVVETLSAAG